MKKITFLFVLFALCASQLWAFTYGGKTIVNNTEFTRAQIGSSPSSIKEISGMTCSRTTPGYFWVELDDPDDDNKIYALNADGSLKLTLTLSGLKMRDWEDIASATVGGKNYILIGGFGDNDCAFKGDYHIYVFEEPAISGSTASVASGNIANIKFGYPDSKAHNAEALMYDPVDNLILVVDKWVDRTSAGSVPNTVYSTPFRTTSGTVTLSTVQSLGTGNEFITLTAADISADGQHILIKNEKNMLYWRRQSSTEPFAVAIAREPQYVSAYSAETQGESVAWSLDALKFYTTSDEKGASKMYSYTRPNIPVITPPTPPVSVPTGVGASATDKTVTVTWGAVDGATGYVVNLCHQTETAAGAIKKQWDFTGTWTIDADDADANLVLDTATGNNQNKRFDYAPETKTEELTFKNGTKIPDTEGLKFKADKTNKLRLGFGVGQLFLNGKDIVVTIPCASGDVVTVEAVSGSAAEVDRGFTVSGGTLNTSATSANVSSSGILTEPSGIGTWVYTATSSSVVITTKTGGMNLRKITVGSSAAGAVPICDTYPAGASATSLTIPDLDPETQYTYQVKAIRSAEESAYSTAKTITTASSGTGITDLADDRSPIRIENGRLVADQQPIAVYNTLGQLVLSSAVSPVDVSSLKGIYIVRAGTASLKVKF